MNDTELIAHAATKLQNAIRPLAYEQPHWDGRPRWSDPLYTRIRAASTHSTNTTGAPAQASKAPTRMDLLSWLCDIDAAVSDYPGSGFTITRLRWLHDNTWTPDHLAQVKAITRACDTWTASARQLLGDTPPSVPLRKPCPLCDELWHRGRDGTRDFALKATATMINWHATCTACRTVWSTDAERALLLRMLNERHNTP